MPKRPTRNTSVIFKDVLSQAEKKLLVDADTARNYNNPGIKGDERSSVLAAILSASISLKYFRSRKVRLSILRTDEAANWT
jgi:hypothetical protein